MVLVVGAVGGAGVVVGVGAVGGVGVAVGVGGDDVGVAVEVGDGSVPCVDMIGARCNDRLHNRL